MRFGVDCLDGWLVRSRGRAVELELLQSSSLSIWSAASAKHVKEALQERLRLGSLCWRRHRAWREDRMPILADQTR
jgi:hypothetical protein